MNILLIIVSYLILAGYFWQVGLNDFFQVNGGGVGLIVFMCLFSLLCIKKRLPKRAVLLLYLALFMIWLNYRSYQDLIGWIRDYKSLTAFIVSLEFFLFYFFLIFCLHFLITDPLKIGLVVGDRNCTLLHKYFSFPIFWSILTFPIILFYLRLFTPPGKISDIYYLLHTGWFIVGQLLAWSATFLLSRKVDKEIIRKFVMKFVEKIGFETYSIKKPLLIIVSVTLIVGTLFEFFRGMWVLWFSLAIWFALMMTCLWRIWSHILDFKPEPLE